uniref:Putative secreted protein n=1 Tax=Anopheles darlingi TaxID=43151 RepID=A0A2M4DI01_ANODA
MFSLATTRSVYRSVVFFTFSLSVTPSSSPTSSISCPAISASSLKSGFLLAARCTAANASLRLSISCTSAKFSSI